MRARNRIDEAARFMPLEQMALSPQCGFSSTVHGNAIAVEAQRAKSALVVETANDVWGFGLTRRLQAPAISGRGETD